MKLRKENRNSLQILTVEGPVSARDCGVLLTGLRKLIEAGGSWVIDLSSSQLDPESTDELERLLLDTIAYCSNDFWIVGTHRLAHSASLDELEGLCVSRALATARQEAWFDARIAEIRQRTTSINGQLRASASAEMLALRRENSRLKRRLVQLQLDSTTPGAAGAASEPRPPELAAIENRILRSMDHALHPRERS
jgi:hypothetical protein